MEINVRKLSIDNKLNFWKEYPDFTIYFNSLYSSDKTVGKSYSSKIMWALALAYSKTSQYVALGAPIESRKEKISKNYMKDNRNFKWTGEINGENMEDIEAKFIKYTTTQAERTLDMWNARLYDIQKLCAENLTKDTDAELRKEVWVYMEKLDKIFLNYNRIKKIVLEESENKSRGNKDLSLADTDI